MTEFRQVVSSDEAHRRLGGFQRMCPERISIDDAMGRYLAEDVLSPEDLPERPRSTVDGYAVKANDTFGASDSLSALLQVAGAVEMGKRPEIAVTAGCAVQIPTGGSLPPGADAVVMVEYTDRVNSSHVEVSKPVTLNANVVVQGEDARKGAPVLAAGRHIRAQEVGLLAALGVCEVSVIRDANGHSIAALVRACGAEVTRLPIVPDDDSAVRGTIERALEEYDVVVLSGGSSVGMRDLVVDVLSALPGIQILAHGIAIRPGKPALFARCANKAIIDLPGHPVSALIVAQVFLAPLLIIPTGSEIIRPEEAPQPMRAGAILEVNGQAAARALDLDFIPITRERYDFVIPTELMNGDNVRALLELIRSAAFRGQVCALGGYEVEETGKAVS